MGWILEFNSPSLILKAICDNFEAWVKELETARKAQEAAIQKSNKKLAKKTRREHMEQKIEAKKHELRDLEAELEFMF